MTMEKHVVGQLKSTGSKTANENCYVTQTPSTFLEALPYYYGCISREDAEWILYDENCPDGMYLLRESGNDLVLSLCHHNSILHYRINKLPNGDVVLQGLPNQTFSSPMELIETVDGLACKPTRPLKALYGKCLPPIHWCLSEETIREQLIARAPDWGLTVEQLRDNLDCDLHFSASFSPIVRSLIVKSLHEIQPWYHFRLSRTDAERRLESSGYLDGKFLVRERDESSYAICLSHESRVKHYRIDILPSGNFAIQDGPKFESIIALVSHYTIFSGGLWCMLGEGCPRPQEMVRQYAEQSSAQISNHLGPNSQHSHQQTHGVHHHNAQQQFVHPHSGSAINGTISRKEALLSQYSHQRSRSIDRFGEKCRICIQNSSKGMNVSTTNSAMPASHLHHLHHPRLRRVSTPTNLKLKEWFTTINHKWARIKRQVILHHQRQQPLINEDNYGTREEFSCCHVSSATLKHPNQKANKILSDMFHSARNNNATLARSHPHYHHCNIVDLQYSSGTTGGGNRYSNGFGSTYGYGVRRQQFGRWHEEPIFSSRYAFDCDMDGQMNGTGHQKQQTTKQQQFSQNKQSNSVTSTPNNCKGTRLSTNDAQNLKSTNGDFSSTNGNVQNHNTDNGGNHCNENTNSNIDLNFSHRPALIKSSSIDTIAAICTDPLEEVRRLHLRECDDILDNHIHDDDQDEENHHFQSLNLTPSLFGFSVGNKNSLKRTNSFDGASRPVNGDTHCNCNCSDWLLDFDIDDSNDPFGPCLPDDVDFSHLTANQQLQVNGTKCCEVVPDANNNSNSNSNDSTIINPSQPIAQPVATMQEELANLFTPSMCSINNSATISTLSPTPFSSNNNNNNNNNNILLSSASLIETNNNNNNNNNAVIGVPGSISACLNGSTVFNGSNTTVNGCCTESPLATSTSPASLQLAQFNQQQQFKQFAANLNGRLTLTRKGFQGSANTASVGCESFIKPNLPLADNLKQSLILNSSGYCCTTSPQCHHHNSPPYPLMLANPHHLLSHSQHNSHSNHHHSNHNNHHYNSKSFLSGTSSCSSGGSSGGSHSSTSLTSTGSSGGGGGTGSACGVSGLCSNRSFSSATTVSPLHASQYNGHLSAHSTSMTLNNGNLMDSNGITTNTGRTSDEINHHLANIKSTTTTTKADCCNVTTNDSATLTKIDTSLSDHQMTLPDTVVSMNVTTATSTASNTSSPNSAGATSTATSISTSTASISSTTTASTSKPSSSVPVIIDLLKEFDVCFTSNDIIDDDSSTLTDNSSPHSFNSPLKRKCINNVFLNETVNNATGATATFSANIGGDKFNSGKLFSTLLPNGLTANNNNGLNLNSINGSGATVSSSSSSQPLNSSNTSNQFHSVSSIPAPTMPPPPPPNAFSLSTTSSSSSSSANSSSSSGSLSSPCPSPPPPAPPLSCLSMLKTSSSSTTTTTNSYPLASATKSTTNETLSKSLASASLPTHPQPSSSLGSQSKHHHHPQQQQQQQQVPLGFDDNNRAIKTIQQQQQQNQSPRFTNDSNGTATVPNENVDKMKNIELICLNEEPEEVQETIKRYRRGPICFDPRCISLKRRIGNGYFGDVFLATIPSTSNATSINLAVKMLKSHAVPQQKAEILREAQTMAKLDHRHIVRLIGVCEGDPFMLVMELAPLGPLNKYLQNYGANMGDDDILRLMLQVSSAMQYLEEMNYVHRDLAARNILLVNEKFAKVSDFGMSRALGQGKDYYKARSASKWPLKWYAPECIYYYKFSSRSDVWSYGVALWEAMSRGEMPYQGMDGQDILRMFTENRRLPKPEKCPVIIYQLMWSCWQFKPEDRVNFASITEQLGHHLAAK